MLDVVSELEKLERMAMHGEDMPTGLTQSEQLFYLSMVRLYGLYRNHTYTKAQAKDMKQDILAAYHNNEFAEKLFNHHVQIRNRYSQVLIEAEKHGCPICKKLVRIFDGRESKTGL